MSYNSNKNLLSTSGVAVFASLGVHGLLWAVLPGLTLDSQTDKSPSQRTIGLVDLSPQEQSRLPQDSNPADNNLPAFASQLSALPPLPPAPPYQTYQTRVEPPLRLSPGSAPIYNTIPNRISPPPLQTFRVPLPPPPTNTSFPPIPYENLPSSPNNSPLPSPPQAPPFVLPANNGLPNTALTPDRTLPSEDDVATATPSPEPSLPPSPDNSNPSNPQVAANKLPERGKQELIAMRDSMRNNFPPRATQPTARSMSRSEIAAALRSQNRSNQTPTQTTNRSMSRSEIVAALRDRPLSEDTKTALDNLEKFKQQQATVQAQNPNAVTKPPIRRKLTTCDRSIDGDIAIVGVVVSPEGKRLSEPNLITKTGEADITQAQNYVRKYEFAKTGETNNYNFRLEFDYSASKCTQPKPTTDTPEATNTSTQSPTPSSSKPIPTFKPNPTSSSKPIPTFRQTPSSSKPIPTFRPNPTNTSSPIPTVSPDSVTPSPDTTTPQSAPSPLDADKPSF